jgi:putative ABC transport system permease protein
VLVERENRENLFLHEFECIADAGASGMKFLPLIWSGLIRKPLRASLTILSAVAAFMLFGLTLGLDASVHRVIRGAHQDCIFVSGRFGDDLPISQREQILKLPHIVRVGYWGWINGYYRDPKNFTGALMLNQTMHRIWSELPLSDAQFQQLRTTRTGVFVSQVVANNYDLRAGSTLPILSVPSNRADGSTVWPLRVLGIFHDLPTDPEGLIIGDYTYYDQSLPLDARGKVNTFEVLVDDPANADAVGRAIDRLFENSANPTQSITEKALYESATLSGIDVADIGYFTEGAAAAGLFMMLFLIGNTITQSVRERMSEFATMKAMGFPDWGVMALVMGEAAIPSTLGAAIGLLLALGASPVWPLVIPRSWAMPAPDISSTVIGMAIFLAFLIAGICALVPSLRLKRLNLPSALAGR